MESLIEQGVVGAIIPAGGLGKRFCKTQPKQFVKLAGWPVLAHTLARFDACSMIDKIVVVVPYDQVEAVKADIIDAYGFSKVEAVVPGGDTRQDSVYQGFLALPEGIDLVVVHDGVRPLVSVATIEAVVEAAQEYGSSIAAVSVRDTLKRVENGVIQETIDRSRVWQAQTPQAFSRDILAEALARARKDNFIGTDEASLVERLGHPIRVVPSETENIKITMPEDLKLAETLIQDFDRTGDMRIGMGFDVHKLVEGRKLMLGGVEIPFDRGLEGHSDADVMAHAFCDAMLGAAGLGDIGRHFSDKDPEWKGAAGTRLLELTVGKIREAGFDLVSADLTLLAQVPKITPYAEQMIKAMAEALNVEPCSINIKATTTEGLGYVGREEGLAASAVVLLNKKSR